MENLQVEEWLSYFKNSDFVITDSFHGTCMAILFGKPFIAIGNPGRGTSRFESLLGSLGLTGRYVQEAEQIKSRIELLEAVDYASVNRILEEQRAVSRQWLLDALDGKIQNEKPRIGAKARSLAGCELSCAKYGFGKR